MCSDWRLGKVPLMVAIVAQLPGYMRLEASPEEQPVPYEPLPLAGIMASDNDNSPASLGSQPVSVLNDPPKRIRRELIVASLPFIKKKLQNTIYKSVHIQWRVWQIIVVG